MAEELELIFDEYDKQQREAEFQMMQRVQRDLLFHDTVPLPEEQLPQAREKAAKQKELVLSYFRDRFSMNFTPVEMHQIMEEHGEKILLNSVRRSITDLTKESVGGKLIKCDWSERRMGAYGKPNRTWKYNLNFINPINPQK